MENIEKIFNNTGGTFLTSPKKLSARLKNIKAFIFDWDGVFNNGEKNENGSSNFSEVDSMGTNMLRFSSWLSNQQLPYTAILSGEHNSASFIFSAREHFTDCYYNVSNKIEALNHFCNRHQLKPEEVAFLFDDVLDLSVAQVAGLRIVVNRKANPLFMEYIKSKNLADYITAAESGRFAVRETCELLMGLAGNYDETISNRSAHTADYRAYVDARNKVVTEFFTKGADKIIEQHPGR